MSALTEQGFKRPIFSEILDGQIQKAKELFGEDIDVSEQTPLGKFIRITVYDLARAYEDLENTYYARFPNTARGTSLDRLCVFAGITRNPPTAATHQMTIYGEAGGIVKAGTLLGTTDGINFYVEEDTEILVAVNPDHTEEHLAYAVVRCTEYGTIGNVAIGEISVVVNPDTIITGVKHTAQINIAVDEETDTELRERFAATIAGTGSATADAIKAEVMRVTNVRSCTIVENDKDTADANGRPPHSFEAYVGADAELYQDIAKAIFSKKPVGIQTHGTITQTVTAEDGTGHTIKFSPLSILDIVVTVTIQKNSLFPSDGIEQIKKNLVDYIATFGAGEDVNKSSLYGYVHSVAGVVVSDIVLSTETTGSTERISVSIDKVASLSTNNVRVTVTEYAD